MEFDKVVLARRSIRRFTKEKVSEEIIKKLLEYAMAAPSAHNQKPWEFYVITNQVLLENLRLSSIYTKYESPLNIIVAGNEQKMLKGEVRDYWYCDCSAAIQNILLGAVSLGLGACWCGLHPLTSAANHVKKILELPEYIYPLALIHIGYPLLEKSAHFGIDENIVHYYKE